MSPQIRRVRRGLCAAAAAAILVAMPLTALTADPAQAGQGSGNPTMAAVPGTGLALTGKTMVQVTGRDYLVPPHAAGTPVSGGIYVFFGWVDSTKAKWGPSARNVRNTDGNFGTTYLYPGVQGSQDGENESPSIGYVAFTKEVESGEAPAYYMDGEGNWKMPIEVPGSTFRTTLPGTTDIKTTDCTKVICGIFTIGAHGKTSATNEVFIPLKFRASSATSPTPKASATPKPTTSSNSGSNSNPDAPGDTSSDSDGPASSPLPKTGIDDESSASVVRPETPIDGQTVAIGVNRAADTGSGDGLALLGVAALVALVVALGLAVSARFRNT